MHSAHHFYNFNQLVSGFIAQNKKVTNNVHLMTFENLETCGNLWGNNSNSTHVDWWTAKHHFSRPRHKQDRNPRGPGMRIVVYTRNLLPVSRPRGQPSRYLKLSNIFASTSEKVTILEYIEKSLQWQSIVKPISRIRNFKRSYGEIVV